MQINQQKPHKMGGVIGGAGGYATVAPTRNYLGEAMANVQDSMFRQNAQRIADERTKAEAERQAIEDRRRDFQDAQEFAKQNPFIATGTGLDASNRQAYMNAKEVAAEARNNFMKTGDQKYNAIYENAIASVSNLSQIPNKLNALKEDMVKNIASYNPESLKLKAALLDKLGNGDIVQTNDANGNARYSIFNRDAQGNLEKIAYKELSGQQLLELLTPVKSFNITREKGLVDQFQKSIGKAIPKEEIIGGQIVKSLYTPGSEEVAKTMAKAATKNKEAVYTALQDLGLDPENEANYSDKEVLGKVTSYYEDLLNKNAPKTETSRLPNYEAQKIALQKEKEANDQKQRDLDNKRNKEKDKTDADNKAAEKNTEKVSKTSIKLTPAGEARLAKYKKDHPEIKNIDYNLVGFAPGEYETVTTSSTVVKKSNPTPAKNAPAKKEIKRSDIAAKAKAAGYTTKEYEALLIKNGVTIK